MSLPFFVAGGLVAAIALGWIGGGAATTPAWVLGSLGLAFLAGGVALVGVAAGRATPRS